MSTLTPHSYVPYLGTRVRVGALARRGVGIQQVRRYLGQGFDVRPHRSAAKLLTVVRVIDLVRHVDELPTNLRVAQIAATQGKRTIESIDPTVLYDPFWDGRGGWRVHGGSTFDVAELYDRLPDPERELHHDQIMLRVQGLSERAIMGRLGLHVREHYRIVGRPFRALVPARYGAHRRAQCGIVLGYLATGGDGAPSAMRTALGTSIELHVEFAHRLGLIKWNTMIYSLADPCARLAQERGTIRP